MNNYAVEIEVDGRTFRYSTLPYTELINVDDGQIPLDFLPHILDIDLGESAVSLEGEATIPSTNIKVWDGKGVLSNFFKELDYEASEVRVYSIDSGKKLIFSGYLTDFSYTGAEVSFSVRVDERFHLKENIWIKFKANTFQYFDVRRPLRVEVATSWVKSNEMQFEIAPCQMWSMPPEVRRDPPYESDIDMDFDLRTYPCISSPIAYYVAKENPEERQWKQFEGGFSGLNVRINPHNFTRDRIFADSTQDLSSLLITIGDDGYVDDSNVLNRVNKIPKFILDDNLDAVRVEWQNIFGLDPSLNLATIGWPNSKSYEVFSYEGFASRQSWNREKWGFDFDWKAMIPGISTFIADDPDAIELYEVLTKNMVVDLLTCETLNKVDPYGRSLLFQRDYVKFRDRDMPPIIRPVKNFNGNYRLALDEVVVKTNVFAPQEILDNPALALGFMMFPTSTKDKIRFITEDSFKSLRTRRPRIFRYRIIDAKVINNEQYLKMEIHNSAGMKLDNLNKRMEKWDDAIPENQALAKYRDWNPYIIDEYHYDHPQALDYFPVSTVVEVGTPLVPMNHNRHVSTIEFQIDVPNTVMADLNTSGLSSRLRGQRIEVIRDYESMVRELSSLEPQSSNHSEVNLNLLNNISGEYAVVKDSSVFYSDRRQTLIEKVQFDVEGAVTKDDVLQAEGGTGKGSLELDSDPKWTNLLSYNFSNFKLGTDILEVRDLLSIKAAEDYFVKKRYRIIRDPVPQKSSSLGSSFPILYGNVKNMPMIHAVGSNVTMEASSPMSAGNDIYIFSSNECNITDDSDIEIRLSEEGSDGSVGDSEFGFSSLYPHIIKSPFPNVEDGHIFRSNGINRKGQISTPYHRVKKFTTLQGDQLYGIQLRGSEWDSELGFSDKRFPIRNGVGNTPLLASLSGAFRRDSRQTICHPCDIFIQFVRDNCEHPYSISSIDLDSFQRVKSLTRWYEASVPLFEEILPFELMDKIVRQFGYYWSIVDGKIYLSIADMDRVNHSKFISENGDLVGDIQEIDEGYKNTYSEIIYKYDKDWSTNGFKEEINLNSRNNRYCAISSAAKGGKGTFTVEAEFVYSHSVARDVSNRLAKVLCRRRKLYKASVRKRGVRYIPGDVVNITYSELGLRYSPVLIMSVKEVRDKYELTFLRFF